jgi:hypothetical protein
VIGHCPHQRQAAWHYNRRSLAPILIGRILSLPE